MLYFWHRHPRETNIEATLIKPGDVIQHEGITYEALEDRDDESGCDGCVADNDENLCRALPDCAAGDRLVLFARRG